MAPATEGRQWRFLSYRIPRQTCNVLTSHNLDDHNRRQFLLHLNLHLYRADCNIFLQVGERKRRVGERIFEIYRPQVLLLLDLDE